jgi:hypothetical protein
MTLSTRAAVVAWANRVEGEIDELRSAGIMQPRGISFLDLVSRYMGELYPMRRWGRTKNADLLRLKKDLGHLPAGGLQAAHFTQHFRKRHAGGAGAVVISSQMGPRGEGAAHR